jgi:DNA-binding CsgD family transcriptional regulator
MKYRTRTYYTDAQKALMWERWKEGWTLHQIAQLFNRAHTSVQGILSRTGGIRPAARSRSATTLTLAEREEISRAMVEGQSIRSVAARLGRAPSTVSREINRNGGQSDYRARSRQCCLGSCASFEALQTGREHSLGAHRDRQASAAVVAGTNRRMAQAYLSARREPARVTRDHLPQPLHSIAWCLEEGAAAAFETDARHASVSASHAEDRHPRADRWRRVDQRVTCVRRGPRGARSLGGRPAVRQS